MPKRKRKETKPRKRLGKKELLIPPIAMGGATLVALVILPALGPPLDPTQVCLKAHKIETFQLYPRVEVMVDGQQLFLPTGVGTEPNSKGEECLRPLHTDEAGNIIHIEYIRPIRFTMGDFMKIYSPDNSTIKVLDGTTGNITQTLTLADYNVEYSYYSEAGEFTEVPRPSDVPPFPADNKMVARITLTRK